MENTKAALNSIHNVLCQFGRYTLTKIYETILRKISDHSPTLPHPVLRPQFLREASEKLCPQERFVPFSAPHTGENLATPLLWSTILYIPETNVDQRCLLGAIRSGCRVHTPSIKADEISQPPCFQQQASISTTITEPHPLVISQTITLLLYVVLIWP